MKSRIAASNLIRVRSPGELSATFLEAYNARDADTMRSLLAPEVAYIRPGPTRFTGIPEIMDRYRRDWERYDTENVVRETYEDGNTAVMEITIKFGVGEESEAVVVTRWVGEKMVSYRLYMDGL